jgi:hypothetical protein
MVMENLIFVGVVFAIGIILFSVWQSVSGPRNSEPEDLNEVRDAFQQRVYSWNREQRARRVGLKTTADIMAGEKYVVETKKWRPLSGRARRASSSRVRQQFELIG